MRQVVLAFGLSAAAVLPVCAGDAMINEEFTTLAAWRPLAFPGIDRHSTYACRQEGTRSVLAAKSDRSASALIMKTTFDVYRFPEMTWSWRIDGTVPGGDHRTRKGDDYAIRLYVVFAWTPEKAAFWEKTKYEMARLVYGEYPPDSTLNYIWANQPAPPVIVNAYTDRARMIPVETGSIHVGQWRSYRVNILEDYRRAFGTDPPATAAIAIMSDTDDTGGHAAAAIDYIRLTPPSSFQEQGSGQREHGQANQGIEDLPGTRGSKQRHQHP